MVLKRRFIKEVIGFGTSLGIVLDKYIKETLNLKKGDRLVFDVVRILKKKKEEKNDREEKTC